MNPNGWTPYVMVRILAFFMAGILVGNYFPSVLSLNTALVWCIVLGVGYVVGYLFFRCKHTTLPMAVVGLFLIFLFGFLHISIANTHPPNHFSNYQGNVEYYELEMVTPSEKRSKTWRYTALIHRVYDGNKWHIVSGKMRLYILRKTDDTKPIYVYGDRLLVKGSPQAVAPPSNPHAFDNKTFLATKQIFHQHIVSPEKIRFVASSEHRNITYYSYVARAWIVEKLQQYVLGEQERAVALALLVGISDGLDNTLREAYAASGAMHVLAVSGLHVGIIYALIIIIFRPLSVFSWSRWVVALVSLTTLWSYAFLTGLSPSVLRAATMFSFLVVGQLAGRKTNAYNTLAGSAFLLLIVNPQFIVSVGFQLSYLAVLGILYFHRPLYSLWTPKVAPVSWLWSLTCVSIAAQLVTFPLALLYFHQFPVYFLLSNIFVAPSAVLILIGGILTVGLGAVPLVASLLGWGLEHLIGILNWILFFIQDAPFSVAEELYITPLQCVTIFLLLLCIVLLIRSKQFFYVVIACVIALTFTVSRWHHFYEEVVQQRLVVYDIPNHTGVEWIAYGTSFFYADEELAKNAQRIDYHISPNRLFCGVTAQRVYSYQVKQNKSIPFFRKKGKNIVLLTYRIPAWSSDQYVDYLIVGHHSIKSWKDISTKIRFDKLILDSSNSKKYCERIMKEANYEHIYSVPHQGAYVEKF